MSRARSPKSSPRERSSLVRCIIAPSSTAVRHTGPDGAGHPAGRARRRQIRLVGAALVDVPVRQSHTYGWLRLPVPVRPEPGASFLGCPPDCVPELDLGAVVPAPGVVPPTDGAAA